GEEVQSEGIQVLLSDPSAEHVPRCPHGPALLFVKVSQGKEKGRRFYACSACRDRKDCRFFQWADEKVSEARLLAREEYNRSCQPPLSHQQYMTRFLEFLALPLAKRKFCKECQQLLLEGDWQEHSGHHLLGDVSVADMKRPSRLLHPLENKKSNAQYLFTERSCTFFMDTIISLDCTRVLCVGTPSLHVTYSQWRHLSTRNTLSPKQHMNSSQTLQCQKYRHPWQVNNHHFLQLIHGPFYPWQKLRICVQTAYHTRQLMTCDFIHGLHTSDIESRTWS
ncbi:Zinc finger CCHC, partial [Pristimantis euphronides]